MSRTVARFLRMSGAVPGITPATRLNLVKLRSLTSMLSLVFVDDDPVPRYVLKVERDRARAPKLLAACEAMRAVAQVPHLRNTVPEIVFCGGAGSEAGMLATMETFLDGPVLAIPLGVARDRGDHEKAARLLRTAYQWLEDFHRAFRHEEPGTLAERFLEDLNLRIASPSMAAALPPEFFGLLGHLSASICVHALPWGRIHGDFNPYNVILTNADPPAVGVIDWDGSEPGCQLWDVFQMAVIAHLLPADPQIRIPLQTALWEGSDPEADAFLTTLARYSADPQAMQQFRRAYALYLAYMLAGLQLQAGDRPEPMLDFWKALLVAELRHHV